MQLLHGNDRSETHGYYCQAIRKQRKPRRQRNRSRCCTIVAGQPRPTSPSLQQKEQLEAPGSWPGFPGDDSAAAAPAALPLWLALLPVCLALVCMCSVASTIIPVCIRVELTEILRDCIARRHCKKHRSLHRPRLRILWSTARSACNRGADLLLFNSLIHSTAGMIAEASKNIGTTPDQRPEPPKRNNWKLREVGRCCPATMVQQPLPLCCLRGLRCFRIVWQWSLCVPLRPQSFPPER